MPKIGGRFEYDFESGVLEVWASTGGHQVFSTTADGDDILKFLRGGVPVKYTGGSATAKSRLTWADQLAGLSEATIKQFEADTGRQVRQPPVAARGIVISETELEDLISGILS